MATELCRMLQGSICWQFPVRLLPSQDLRRKECIFYFNILKNELFSLSWTYSLSKMLCHSNLHLLILEYLKTEFVCLWKGDVSIYLMQYNVQRLFLVKASRKYLLCFFVYLFWFVCFVFIFIDTQLT